MVHQGGLAVVNVGDNCDVAKVRAGEGCHTVSVYPVHTLDGGRTMPVDPQVRKYLDEQAALGAPPPGSVSVADQRKAMRTRRLMAVEDRAIPGPAGQIAIRTYLPAGPRPMPILVYFHGGGYVVGDIDGTDLRSRVLAEWA